MKRRTLLLSLCALFSAGISSADDTAKPPKLDVKELHAYSYCGTEGKHLFDKKDKRLFDELKVSMTSAQQTRFRISGKKKTDHVPYGGDYIYHLGKVVLIPVSQRTGWLSAEIDKDQDGAPTYYLVFQLTDDTLKSQTFTMTKGGKYTFSMSKGENDATLTIKEGGNVVSTLSAPSAKVREFGFASTVRFVGNEVDMTVAFDWVP